MLQGLRTFMLPVTLVEVEAGTPAVQSRLVSKGGGKFSETWKEKQSIKLGALGNSKVKNNTTKIFLKLSKKIKNDKNKNSRKDYIIKCGLHSDHW